MAYRDKGQGFAFVYVDIKKLLESSKKPLDFEQPLTEEVKDSKVVRFNRDTAPVAPAPKLPTADFVPIQPSQVPLRGISQVRERAEAITQIKKNLDRLQSLHHKLHAMLEDLNSVSESRKKKKE
ncbi:MAG: hypothetical protein KDD51_04760 [Bdellovibrionales bacterium]|nr:hypothetical protein [Bdellovibrionales bacterium]